MRVLCGVWSCLVLLTITHFTDGSGGSKKTVGNGIYTFGTIQMDPMYSQYGFGFIRNLTALVTAHLGLEYRIVSYSGNITGAWDNLVHTVANGEIDVGATILTRTKCREKLVSFTAPFLTSTLSALYHGNRGVVRSPDELLTSGFQVGTLNHSSITDVLADSSDTNLQDVLSTVLSNKANLVHTVGEGIERARHSNYIFIVDTVVATYTASQRPCVFKTVRLTSTPFEYGFIVGKGSPLLKPLSNAIEDLYNEGTLQEMIKKLIYDTKQCGKYDKPEDWESL